MCVLGRVPGTELALPRFSRIALAGFAVIVLTGLYQTWRQVGTLPALSATEFGRLLLIKLGGIALILVLASQARRFVHRSQPLTERSGWPWLRRSLAVEGLLGVAVLAVATVMVNTSPARASYTPPVHAKLALPRPLDGAHVEVRLSPAKQGLNVADIYVVTAEGGLRAVPEVTAQLAPGRRGAGPAEAIKVDPAEPGHYVADTVSIPYAGVWQLLLYVHTGEFDEASLLVRFRAH
jgi:copper transport protein